MSLGPDGGGTQPPDEGLDDGTAHDAEVCHREDGRPMSSSRHDGAIARARTMRPSSNAVSTQWHRAIATRVYVTSREFRDVTMFRTSTNILRRTGGLTLGAFVSTLRVNTVRDGDNLLRVLHTIFFYEHSNNS